MTRHGLQFTMTAISASRSPGWLVQRSYDNTSVCQRSIAKGSVGPPLVSKAPDYANACSLSSAAPTISKTIRNSLSP